jgi:hypothetical protein
MSRQRIFLVVPGQFEADFATFVEDALALACREDVVLITDCEKDRVKEGRKDATTDFISAHIESYSPKSQDWLYVHNEVFRNQTRLSDWWQSQGGMKGKIRVCPSKRIKPELKGLLEQGDQHWRRHAEIEVGKFEGKTTKFEVWLQQFGVLRCNNLGRKLASQLQVIKLGSMAPSPFSLLAADEIGQLQLHCHIEDGDPGGSWLEIKNMLAHERPPESVGTVEWQDSNSSMVFPDHAVDQFILYEDGLWSGYETIKRLRAIAVNPPVAQIVLKFGIVSDFGLQVCRYAIRKLGLGGKVRIETVHSHEVRFLRGEFDAKALLAQDLEVEEFYRKLHDFVRPTALIAAFKWEDKEHEACKTIGKQLVEQWIQRKTSSTPDQLEVDRYCLGGGGFASTTLFTRSVPKVCLPLIWLDGEVELNGQRVQWKPLFIDSRRVAAKELLYGY